MSSLRQNIKIISDDYPWVDSLPSNWNVCRLRNVVEMLVSNVDKITNESEFPVRLCNYVDVYKNDRITEKLSFMVASATKEEINQFRLHRDDVIITKDSEMWNDIGVPSLVKYTSDDLICGYHLAILRAKKDKLLGSFLFRVLQGRDFQIQFFISANGVTRYGLSQNSIKNVLVPIPPLDEQEAIVRFLDHTDRKIKRYIRAKQKLIKLLNEQKQAIIHQGVTRGLDTNVRFKPSGVEWLGDVPEHWEIKRLKTISKIRYGLGQPPKEDCDGIPLIRATNIDSGLITEKDLALVDISDVPASRNAFLKEGEIIVVRSGAYTADSAIIPKKYENAIAGYDMVVTVFNALAEFIAFSLLSDYVRNSQLIPASMRSAQPHLNAEELGNAIIFLPPHEEQIEINRFILRKITALKDTINQYSHEIELIKEYRIRLIADVVTGKVDIRDAVTHLPAIIAETEVEIEPLEEESGEMEELQETESDGE
jgi:type I restriction enzyme, S subunit